jgi:acetolactate synthase-1/2/3 large subunit
MSQTCAHQLLRLLKAYGVDTAFGIPGVHTIELYRELSGSRLRHVTPPAAGRRPASSSPAPA